MKRYLHAVFVLVLALSAPIASGVAPNARGLPDFTDLVEKQGAAVVNISTTQVIRGRSQQALPFDEDDPAFDFFRRFFPRPQGGDSREIETHSLGSGFIISSDGYILTNAHVVESANEITVRLTDKREFRAKAVGADKRTDVALIKIEASGLPTVHFGDANALKVGEWVVAIGSPFGFENSVTAGIVSAKGRNLPQENFVPFIQTDVAVNPGNSGGPLFNMKGEVVGINSQIYSRTGGFMGLSFAIPIDIAMEIQSQLRASGRVSRGRIGVVIQEVTKELAESFGLAKPGGALINSVEKGGPADKAGIEAGDVVLKFDGKTVSQSGDLPRIVGATRGGAKVVVQVWRKGSARDVSLTVGEMPGDKLAQSAGREQKVPEKQPNRLGLVVSELTPEQRAELKVAGGLVIESIRANGVRADLRVGDVIVAMIVRGQRSEVKTLEQFNRLLSGFDKSTTITLMIRRGDSQAFVTIKGVDDKRE